jgi:ligand-binding SRPBCC domain-containing protein
MMKHEHYFKVYEHSTLMTDKFQFQSPYGVLGKVIDKLYLKKYMQRLLEERNNVIKKVAETE